MSFLLRSTSLLWCVLNVLGAANGISTRSSNVTATNTSSPRVSVDESVLSELGGLLDQLFAGSTLEASAGSSNCVGINAISPRCATRESPYSRDIFYVGGHYENSALGNLTYDQIYVEKLTPARGVRQPKPIVFFHGGGTSGVTWLNTPDNRKGFASYFIDKGYLVYLIDQTSVGRASHENLDEFVLRIGSTAEISERGFTVPEDSDLYPQSQLHTQWPGSGLKGDPIFDAFEDTFIPLTSNKTAQQTSMRKSGCEMLRLIGSSFLVSHSIGSVFPILLSNDCPEHVAGSINLDPNIIPFEDFTGTGMTMQSERPWGFSDVPLSYVPSISNYTELNLTTVGTDTASNHSCILQTGSPIRKLPNIASVPFVAYTGEASPHATYDHCVISYLQQVGGDPDWVQLGDIGIHGNGHFAHLEMNNLDLAAVAHRWIQKTLAPSRA